MDILIVCRYHPNIITTVPYVHMKISKNPTHFFHDNATNPAFYTFSSRLENILVQHTPDHFLDVTAKYRQLMELCNVTLLRTSVQT